MEDACLFNCSTSNSLTTPSAAKLAFARYHATMRANWHYACSEDFLSEKITVSQLQAYSRTLRELRDAHARKEGTGEFASRENAPPSPQFALSKVGL
jgi:hypothetical protein